MLMFAFEATTKSLSVSDLSITMYPGVPPQAEMKDPVTDKAM